MSEHYLKLVREELKSSTLVQIPSLRLASTLQVIKKSLMGVHVLDELSADILYMLLKRVTEDIELLARIRFLKVISQKQIENNSVDFELAKALLAVLRAEEALFSPVTLKYGERIFYEFASSCYIGGRTYKKGEIAPLSIRELLLAEINECGKVLLDPFYKWYPSTRMIAH